MAFRALPLLLLTVTGACLDFEQFRVEDGGGGTGGAPHTGGTGGIVSEGGAGAQGGFGGEPTQGGMGAGGSGGGPPLGACFPGKVQTDRFDYEPPLDPEVWAPSDNVSIVSNQASLVYIGNDDAVLNLGASDRLEDCYFQIEIVELEDTTQSEVFVVFSAGGEYFGLRLVGHQPTGRLGGTVALDDASPISSGFVRISEQGGEVLIHTGATDNGPWTERLRRPTPDFLSNDGIFVVRAIPTGGNHVLTLDNFNTSTSE